MKGVTQLSMHLWLSMVVIPTSSLDFMRSTKILCRLVISKKVRPLSALTWCIRLMSAWDALQGNENLKLNLQRLESLHHTEIQFDKTTSPFHPLQFDLLGKFDMGLSTLTLWKVFDNGHITLRPLHIVWDLLSGLRDDGEPTNQPTVWQCRSSSPLLKKTNAYIQTFYWESWHVCVYYICNHYRHLQSDVSLHSLWCVFSTCHFLHLSDLPLKVSPLRLKL